MTPRNIEILPVLNGYLVHVGCQTVVFNSTESLLSELGSYLKNPGKVEQDYRENAINRELLCPGEPIPTGGENQSPILHTRDPEPSTPGNPVTGRTMTR